MKSDLDYELLDCGDFKKLERWGPYRFVRPAPQAVWNKNLNEQSWRECAGEFQHQKGSKKSASGDWKFHVSLPEEGWPIRYRGLTFIVKPTPFGHFGLFPEQMAQWKWLEEQLKGLVSRSERELKLINIFGYTGASSIVSAAHGAHITHLDASKATVSWARANCEASDLKEKPMRWIVDDALKFLRREKNRGNLYDGIIMDPPSFGRGPKGEVWKIEEALSELMQACKEVLVEKPSLLLLSSHTPGFTGLTLQNIIARYLVQGIAGKFECGEMEIPSSAGLNLPNGFFARWVVND
jgi:23S rRNA (cytosine1962-C5)-methyltransferase